MIGTCRWRARYPQTWGLAIGIGCRRGLMINHHHRTFLILERRQLTRLPCSFMRDLDSFRRLTSSLWEVIAPHSSASLKCIVTWIECFHTHFKCCTNFESLIYGVSNTDQPETAPRNHCKITCIHSDLVLSWSLFTTTRITQKSIKLYIYNITTATIPLPT